MIKQMNNRHLFIVLTLLIAIGLVLAFTKGQISQTVFFQDDYNTTIGGPFEASNSTSRYALTEAIVKYKSLTFNPKEAKFSSPDVVDYQGKFFSIFTYTRICN